MSDQYIKKRLKMDAQTLAFLDSGVDWEGKKSV